MTSAEMRHRVLVARGVEEARRKEWVGRHPEDAEQVYASPPLAALADEVERLHAAIIDHRAQRGDDRCWTDDQKLYAVLGDGDQGDNRVGDKAAMLKNCDRFLTNRCEGGGPWKTYAELEAENAVLKARLPDPETETFVPYKDMPERNWYTASLEYLPAPHLGGRVVITRAGPGPAEDVRYCSLRTVLYELLCLVWEEEELRERVEVESAENAKLRTALTTVRDVLVPLASQLAVYDGQFDAIREVEKSVNAALKETS